MACIIEYSYWPATGNIVSNLGDGGGYFNGTIEDDIGATYTTLQSSATAETFNTYCDEIVIPMAMGAYNNMNILTYEMFIHVPAGVITPMPLITKGDAIVLYLWPDYSLRWIRKGTSGKSKTWTTVPGVVASNAWNNIQISHDGTLTNGDCADPIVSINNLQRSIFYSTDGAITAWKDDSGYSLKLFPSLLYYPTIITSFRMHDVALTFAAMQVNYGLEYWRIDKARFTGRAYFWPLMADPGTPRKTGYGKLVAQIIHPRVGEVPGLTGRTPDVTLNQTVVDDVTLSGGDEMLRDVE